MKRTFFTAFLFVSLFVLGANSVSAFGGWNSGGAQTMHVNQYYGYSSPAVYTPASAYIPVQNYGYTTNNSYYGGYNTYTPSYYGNSYNPGYIGGYNMGINSGMNNGIDSGMSMGISSGMGWGVQGYMPVGYSSGYTTVYGYDNYGGGCSMYCYGSQGYY